MVAVKHDGKMGYLSMANNYDFKEEMRVEEEMDMKEARTSTEVQKDLLRDAMFPEYNPEYRYVSKSQG